MQNSFSDRVFSVSLLKSVTLAFESLVIEIWYGIGPSLLLDAKWFQRSGVPCITVEMHHPRHRVLGHRNPGLLLAGCYKGRSVELPGLLSKLGLVDLFNSDPFTICTCTAT
jgi:hypothetical protein